MERNQSERCSLFWRSGLGHHPPGGHVLQIIAHSSNALGTVAIFGGTPIPLPNVNSYWRYQPQHLITTAQAASNTIVFTLTQSYLVEVAVPAGA